MSMICVEDTVRVGSEPPLPPPFSALYERHYTFILSYVRRRVGDPFVAEDLTAETFAKAWKAFPRYEERGAPFASWLLSIAHREVITHSRRKRPTMLTPEDVRQLAGTFVLPEDRLMQQERAAWLRAHLRRLPVPQRQALWLRFGEEQSFSEIAVQLGRRENSTRVLLHRALKTLRQRMTDGSARWAVQRWPADAE
jgi:RNA polymerase sigma-70 factor (ECF subfamily)